MLAALTLAVTLSTLASADWGYDHHNGPSSWAGVCSFGQRQSPVDLRSIDIEYAMLKKLHFVNYVKSGPVKVKNNGHTGFDQWGNSQPFILGGVLERKYRLLQIHFHWAMNNAKGSEHTLGSLHYPLEAHFVHQKEGTKNLTSLPGDGLAVVGVFFNIQQDKLPLDELELSVKQIVEPNKDIKLDRYTPIQMVPANRDSFYTYEGSLTTPGCDETVIWTIMAEPVSVTQNQLNLLRRIKSTENRSHDFNHRPTQPLNGRRIKYRSALMNRTVFCHSLQSAATTDKSVYAIVWLMVLYAFLLK